MLRRCGVAALTAMVLPVTAGLGVATSFGAAPRHASAAPPAVQAFGFQPVSPYRLIDTRDTASPVGPGQTIAVPVLGQGPIPGGGVDAVAINVTVTQPTEASYLTVWPSGAP